MNEWLQELKKKIGTIFSEYGKVIFVILILLVSLISISLVTSYITPHKLRVSFLDVGQGDAILIQTPSGKSMLIDGGTTNIILERVARELTYFDRDINVIVATHPDADHVTGLIPILEKYQVGTVVISPAEGSTKIVDDFIIHINKEQATTHIAQAGDVIDFHDGVTAQILYPSSNYKGKKSDTNDASVSIVVTYGDKSFLLTGDLPSIDEPKLIDTLLSLQQSRVSRDELPSLSANLNITVYKAGHHGSKYSSGEQLLTYIKPEYVIVSAGKDNKYGHPNPEAVERLQKYSKEIISTVDRGTISFVTDGRIIEIDTKK
jgi:beta-lactamase superfamily II metal-dependent hydrolase